MSPRVSFQRRCSDGGGPCDPWWYRMLRLALRAALGLAGLAVTGQAVAQGSVTVVNMIPAALSGEVGHDSEPNLAVNPADPAQMAASAFTRGTGFCADGYAPIFVTGDGGDSWQLRCLLPTEHPDEQTYDVSLAFGTSGEALYAATIPKVDLMGIFALPYFDVVRTTAPDSLEPMTSLTDEDCRDVDARGPCFYADQPYVEAVTVAGGDRVYVGYNHMLQIGDPGTTATVFQSLDANPAPPAAAVFRAETIERRSTVGADGPPIRTAVHPDGTVYAAFYRKTAFEQLGTGLGDALYTSDIVVVRDDNGATGPDPYRDLVERSPPRGDGMPGVRVVRQIRVPFVNEHVFGQERVGSRLSLAVDPRSSATVYVAWNDGDWDPDSGRLSQRIHLRRSQDHGGSWSGDLRAIENAINPTVAVDSLGRVGFLYQQLVDRDSGDPRWVTHLEIIRDLEDLRHRRDIVLADVPADSPSSRTLPRVHLPFLGDYLDLLTVGSTFYGVFAAYNKPDSAHFPQGVTYLRRADFDARQLLDEEGELVAESIDPFFFQVTNDLTLDICAARPWLCNFAPRMEPGRLTLRCRARDCLVVDFIDKNCQVKYGGCPGCEPGSLCPPYYNLFFDGLGDDWAATLVDEDFRPVVHRQHRSDKGLVISFRPRQEGYAEGRIGNYRLIFQMGPKGRVGHAYQVNTRLRVSDRPFGG